MRMLLPPLLLPPMLLLCKNAEVADEEEEEDEDEDEKRVSLVLPLKEEAEKVRDSRDVWAATGEIDDEGATEEAEEDEREEK